MAPKRISPQTTSSRQDYTSSRSGKAFDFDNIFQTLNDVAKHPLMRPRVTYGLYIVASVTAIPMLIGLIVACISKHDAPEWLQSHYQFLIRTFWYGLVLIGVGIMTWIFAVGMVVLWALPVWYVARIVRGWMLLENQKPVPDPESWLFG